MLRQKPICIFQLYLALVNLTAFVMMGLDKRRAIKKKWRIPESRLFLPVILGGGIGGILGIYAFRHKTRRKKFTLGFPVITVFETALAYYIFKLLK